MTSCYMVPIFLAGVLARFGLHPVVVVAGKCACDSLRYGLLCDQMEIAPRILLTICSVPPLGPISLTFVLKGLRSISWITNSTPNKDHLVLKEDLPGSLSGLVSR